MNRKEQKEILISSPLWTEESITHFRASFLAHYHVLNELIENAVDCANEYMPRLTFFLVTEHLYLLYSEMCITLECMLKSVLEDNGYSRNELLSLNHRLIDILDKLSVLDDCKAKTIYARLNKRRRFLKILSDNKVFINARYFEIDPATLQKNISIFWTTLMDIDYIANKYYDAGNLINIVYPNSMTD